MKKWTRIIACALALLMAISFAVNGSHAVSFNTLDAQTAVAGASLKLQSFYENNTDAEDLLYKFFYPKEIPEPGEYFDDLVTYENPKDAVVAAESILNVREKATTESEVILTLKRGDTVTVYGEQVQRIIKAEGEEVEVTRFTWYRIGDDSYAGFVRSEFLLFGEEAQKLLDEIEEQIHGKMPGHFDLLDSVDHMPADVKKQLTDRIGEVNYCQNLYAEKAEAEEYINMYSILVYLTELYQYVVDVSGAYNLPKTQSKAVTARQLVAGERDRLSAVTGNSEEDFYKGIVMESEEYKAQQAAAEAAAKAAAEAEARRKAAEQAAKEAADAEARRKAEEAAAAARAEAERLRREQEAAAQAAREAAQREAAQIAAAGANERPDSMGRQIANYAATFIGVLPYVWGGASLTSGADCSGFVGQIMAHFGLLDQATANYHGYDSYGLRYVGTAVTYDASSIQEFVKYLVPGDIICYPGHVAIYYGNGIVVHEPDVGRKAEYGSAMMKQIVTVRRLAPLE